MINKKQLEVYINQNHVGTLAETKDHLMVFEEIFLYIKMKSGSCHQHRIRPIEVPLVENMLRQKMVTEVVQEYLILWKLQKIKMDEKKA